MKSYKIFIIDYGMGNLASVYKAFSMFSTGVKVIDKPSLVKQADKLVLPGVGHFEAGAENLEKLKFKDEILEFIEKGKFFLGICLGLQLLFEKSEESKSMQGLKVLKGSVVKFKNFYNGKKYAVPHMGWNRVFRVKDDKIFEAIKNGEYFYFVHSYFVKPSENVILCESEYGEKFCSGVKKDNIYAFQFHPEKSQKAGLHLIENFALL